MRTGTKPLQRVVGYRPVNSPYSDFGNFRPIPTKSGSKLKKLVSIRVIRVNVRPFPNPRSLSAIRVQHKITKRTHFIFGSKPLYQSLTTNLPPLSSKKRTHFLAITERRIRTKTLSGSPLLGMPFCATSPTLPPLIPSTNL